MGRRKPSPVHGVAIVDKPRGPTSHDVVARGRKAFERLQGTWLVTSEDRASSGMWVVTGQHAIFPMQNERPFVVHVADDGAISLQRRAEGYHASLQRFENDDYVVWNGGAYWTRLEGEWVAQLDDGSTAHYVVRGREVRYPVILTGEEKEVARRSRTREVECE